MKHGAYRARRVLGVLVIAPFLLGPALSGCLSLSSTSPTEDNQDDRSDEDEVGFADEAGPGVAVHFI